MRISSKSLEQQDFRETAIAWIQPILADPNFTGRTFPTTLNSLLYVENQPSFVAQGVWTVVPGTIRLPGQNDGLGKLDKLSVLSALISTWGIQDAPGMTERVMTRLTEIIKETTLSVYSNIISATQRPSRMALNLNTYQIAAEMMDRWTLAGGAPIEVDDTWIILDF